MNRQALLEYIDLKHFTVYQVLPTGNDNVTDTHGVSEMRELQG